MMHIARARLAPVPRVLYSRINEPRHTIRLKYYHVMDCDPCAIGIHVRSPFSICKMREMVPPCDAGYGSSSVLCRFALGRFQCKMRGCGGRSRQSHMKHAGDDARGLFFQVPRIKLRTLNLPWTGRCCDLMTSL